jgi:hypothetical protein
VHNAIQGPRYLIRIPMDAHGLKILMSRRRVDVNGHGFWRQVNGPWITTAGHWIMTNDGSMDMREELK